MHKKESFGVDIKRFFFMQYFKKIIKIKDFAVKVISFRKLKMCCCSNSKVVINCVENLNSVIASDESLGEGFCIGHSYFCNLEVDKIDNECLYGIVEYELIPLLKEYWFDEPTKVKHWSNNLRSAVK